MSDQEYPVELGSVGVPVALTLDRSARFPTLTTTTRTNNAIAVFENIDFSVKNFIL
jgi:hypothetical protein